MLNQVLKVSPGTCQQSVEVLSKSVTFFLNFDFHRVVQQHIAGEVVIFVMRTAHIENFLTNHLVKEF